MTLWLSWINATAELWWTAVVRASWQGGLAIMAAWLLCRFVSALSPVARCWIWRFAYARLFVALFWGSPILLPLLPGNPGRHSPPLSPQAEAPIAGAPAAAPTPVGDRSTSLFGAVPAAPGVETIRPAIQSSEEPVTPASVVPRPETVALLLWLVGVAVCCLRLGRACHAASLLRRSCAPIREPGLISLRDQVAATMGFRNPPVLLAGPELRSPLLLGGRRPAIVLPSALPQASEAELRLILGHELAHLRRGDLHWNWMAAAAHILFFFHPLVWLAGNEWRLTQEMACDELAVRATRAGVGDYAEMLLKIASIAGREPRLALTAAGAGPHHLRAVWTEDSPEYLKRRLTMLRRYVPGNRFPRPMVLTATLLAAGALLLVPWQVTAQEPADLELTMASPAEHAPGQSTEEVGEPGVLHSAQNDVAPNPAGIAVPPPLVQEVGPETHPSVADIARAEGAATGPAVVAPSTPAPPATIASPNLADQWEDVLILEALRYLRLSDEQVRHLLPAARSAEERLASQAQQEKQILATLTRIARENRSALLAGRLGGRQKDALFLENLRKRRRAEAEEKIVASAITQVLAILSRAQTVRASLLTLGEPVQESAQPLSPALLSPEAGFVLAEPQDPDFGKTLGNKARERVQAVRERWDERHLLDARKQLSQRYPEDVVNSALIPSFLDLVVIDTALIDASGNGDLKVQFRATGRKDGAEQNPLLAQARKELQAIQSRSSRSLGQILMTEASREDLEVALRPFVRRLFLSPRLRAVLEARLGLQR